MSQHFDEVVEWILGEIVYCGINGASVAWFIEQVDRFYDIFGPSQISTSQRDGEIQGHQPLDPKTTTTRVTRDIKSQIWRKLSAHSEVIVGVGGAQDELSLDEVEALPTAVETPETLPVIPSAGRHAVSHLTNSRIIGDGQEEPDESTHELPVAVDKSLMQPWDSSDALMAGSASSGPVNKSVAFDPRYRASHSTTSKTAALGEPIVPDNGSGDRLTSDTLSTLQYQPRIRLIQERMWLNLTGHGKDLRRVPKMEWLCLCAIATSREVGITQPELVKLTGQDKRSLPRRADFLEQKGLIIKKRVDIYGNHTSLLVLARFSELFSHDPAEIPHIELTRDLTPIFGYERWTGKVVDNEVMIRSILAITRAWKVITKDDLRIKMGIDLESWNMKAYKRMLRQLTSRGILKNVAANSTEKNGEEAYFKCFRLAREPTDEDWDAFIKKPTSINAGIKRLQSKMRAKSSAKQLSGESDSEISAFENSGEDTVAGTDYIEPAQKSNLSKAVSITSDAIDSTTQSTNPSRNENLRFQDGEKIENEDMRVGQASEEYQHEVQLREREISSEPIDTSFTPNPEEEPAVTGGPLATAAIPVLFDDRASAARSPTPRLLNNPMALMPRSRGRPRKSKITFTTHDEMMRSDCVPGVYQDIPAFEKGKIEPASASKRLAPLYLCFKSDKLKLLPWMYQPENRPFVKADLSKPEREPRGYSEYVRRLDALSNMPSSVIDLTTLVLNLPSTLPIEQQRSSVEKDGPTKACLPSVPSLSLDSSTNSNVIGNPSYSIVADSTTGVSHASDDEESASLIASSIPGQSTDTFIPFHVPESHGLSEQAIDSDVGGSAGTDLHSQHLNQPTSTLTAKVENIPSSMFVDAVPQQVTHALVGPWPVPLNSPNLVENGPDHYETSSEAGQTHAPKKKRGRPRKGEVRDYHPGQPVESLMSQQRNVGIDTVDENQTIMGQSYGTSLDTTTPKRKRGRPRKVEIPPGSPNNQIDTSIPREVVGETAITRASVGVDNIFPVRPPQAGDPTPPPKRKRGRPRKSDVVLESQGQVEKMLVLQPNTEMAVKSRATSRGLDDVVGRGISPLSSSPEISAPASAIRKKRGRPRKPIDETNVQKIEGNLVAPHKDHSYRNVADAPMQSSRDNFVSENFIMPNENSARELSSVETKASPPIFQSYYQKFFTASEPAGTTPVSAKYISPYNSQTSGTIKSYQSPYANFNEPFRQQNIITPPAVQVQPDVMARAPQVGSSGASYPAGNVGVISAGNDLPIHRTIFSEEPASEPQTRSDTQTLVNSNRQRRLSNENLPQLRESQETEVDRVHQPGERIAQAEKTRLAQLRANEQRIAAALRIAAEAKATNDHAFQDGIKTASSVELKGVEHCVSAQKDNEFGNLYLSADKSTVIFLNVNPPIMPFTISVAQIPAHPTVTKQDSDPMHVVIPYRESQDNEVVLTFRILPSAEAFAAANDLRAKIVLSMMTLQMRGDAPLLVEKETGRGRNMVEKKFKCPQCGGSWLNQEGIKYHLTKAKVSCNPNYIPPPEPEPVQKKVRCSKDLPASHREGAAENQLPINKENQTLGNPSLTGSVRADSPVTPSHRRRRAAPRKAVIDLEPAVVSQTNNESPREDVTYETSQINANGLTKKVFSEPKSNASSVTKRRIEGMQAVTDDPEIPSGYTSDDPLPSTELSGDIDYNSMLHMEWQNSKYKHTPAETRFHRRIIMYLIEQNGGVFPGKRGIWYAFARELFRQSPSTRLPRFSTCNAAVKTLASSGKLQQVEFFVNSERGGRLQRQVLVGRGIDPLSPAALEAKEKVKEHAPDHYCPPQFALPPAVKIKLDALEGNFAIYGKFAARNPVPLQPDTTLGETARAGGLESDSEEQKTRRIVLKGSYYRNLPATRTARGRTVVQPIRYQDEITGNEGIAHEHAAFDNTFEISDDESQDDCDRLEVENNHDLRVEEDEEEDVNNEEMDLDDMNYSEGFPGSIAPNKGYFRTDENKVKIADSLRSYWAGVKTIGGDTYRQRVKRRQSGPRRHRSKAETAVQAEKARNRARVWQRPIEFLQGVDGCWSQPVAAKKGTYVRHYRLPEPVTYMQSPWDSSWSFRPYGHGVHPIYARPSKRVEGRDNYTKRIESGYRPIIMPSKRFYGPARPTPDLFEKANGRPMSDMPQPNRRKRNASVMSEDGSSPKQPSKRKYVKRTPSNITASNMSTQNGSALGISHTPSGRFQQFSALETPAPDFRHRDGRRRDNPGLETLSQEYLSGSGPLRFEYLPETAIQGLKSTFTNFEKLSLVDLLEEIDGVAAWEQALTLETQAPQSAASRVFFVNHTITHVKLSDILGRSEPLWSSTNSFDLQTLPYEDLEFHEFQGEFGSALDDAAANKIGPAAKRQKRIIRTRTASQTPVTDGDFEEFGMSRKRSKPTPPKLAFKARYATALPADFENLPEEFRNNVDIAEIDTRHFHNAFRRRNSPYAMPPKVESRLVVAVVVIRALTGGIDKTIDWVLVTSLFPGYSMRHTQDAWPVLSVKYKLLIHRLSVSFQDLFLEAYENEDIDPIDFDHLIDYDWEGLVDYVMEKTEKDLSEPFLRLPARRERLRDIYDIKEELVPNDRDAYFDTLKPIHRRLDSMTATQSILPSRLSARLATISQLQLAKSWARANIMTPENVYNQARAAEKLSSLPVGIMKMALQELLAEKVFTKRNKGRPIPGRGFEIHDGFTQSMKVGLPEKQFLQALNFKLRLDEAFARGESVEVAWLADDGDIMVITNLQACKRILILQHNVPMEKLGLLNGDYQSRKMDRDRLNFGMSVVPTQSYLYDGEVDVLRAMYDGFHEPPLEFENALPIWADINGNLIRNIWKVILTSILSTIALRSGVVLDELVRIMSPTLGLWEVKLVVGWCISIGVLKPCLEGFEGWEATEWWWLVICKA